MWQPVPTKDKGKSRCFNSEGLYEWHPVLQKTASLKTLCELAVVSMAAGSRPRAGGTGQLLQHEHDLTHDMH